jgi:hypothetical protein
MLRVVGIVLLVAGLAGLALGTFQYTRKTDVLDVGPVRVEARERETVAVPPLAAGAVAALGLVLVLVGGRRK